MELGEGQAKKRFIIHRDSGTRGTRYTTKLKLQTFFLFFLLSGLKVIISRPHLLIITPT